MRPSARLIRALARATVVGAALTAPATVGAAGGDVSFTVIPGRVEFRASPDGRPVTQQLLVRVRGTSPGRLTISFGDVVADPATGLTSVPLGSTPYSLASVLTADRTTVDYVPDGGEQEFAFDLTARVASSDAPRAGVVRVTFTPTGGPAPSGGFAIQSAGAVESIVVSGPAEGAVGAELPDVHAVLAPMGLTLGRSRSWTPLDALIPDVFPWLVDHGPVDVTAAAENSGDSIIDTRTSVTFANVGPTALLPGSSEEGNPLYTFTDAPRYALPGQTVTTETSSVVTAENAAPIDSLPLVGFIRVTASTGGSIGPIGAVPVTQSTVVFVFPWKELLGLLVLVGLLWALRQGWRRWRAGRRNTTPVVVARGVGTPASEAPATEDAAPTDGATGPAGDDSPGERADRA